MVVDRAEDGVPTVADGNMTAAAGLTEVILDGQESAGR